MIKVGKYLCTFMFVCFPLLLAGQQRVANVEIDGNERITGETVLYYFNLYPGQNYTPEAVSAGVKALWETGFFSDIKVELKTDDKDRIILLTLKEYPIVSEYVFITDNRIKLKDILNRLQAEYIDITPHSLYDPSRIKRIAAMIEDMLADMGFNEGTVTVECRKKARFKVDVYFHILEGDRYRIGEIEFVGHPKLEKSILLHAFQDNREHNLISWLTGKDILRKSKLAEDMGRLEEIFTEHGYARVKIWKPQIQEYSKRSLFLGAHPMKKIIIPVEAGSRYHIGKIEVRGHQLFTTNQILECIPLRKKQIYNRKLENQAVNIIEDLYQNSGYLFVRVKNEAKLDSQKRQIDLLFTVHEREMISLNRLYITGNTFTRDIVLRREMMIDEQNPFRPDLFSRSLEKLARLGMVKIEEPPEIRQVPEHLTQIDVHMQVTELHRDEWQLTGGYSGYQGLFIGGSLSTVNLVGKGRKFDLALEYGERSKFYSAMFRVPYLFDRQISFRGGIYQKEFVYPELFTRKAQGFELGFTTKVRDYIWIGVDYYWEKVDVNSYGRQRSESIREQNISSISGYLFRNTVEDLFFPTKGMRLSAVCEFSGSELGSDIQYVNPELEGAFFVPLSWKHILGFRLQYRFKQPIQNSYIPKWERYYLGGERSIRGYKAYSIGPRDFSGNNIGGERSLVFNLEYILPVFPRLSAIVFFDAGNSYRYTQTLDWNNLYWSSGCEFRTRILSVHIPLRLILAYNNRLIEKDENHFVFRIALGASF
jgi:outer membrane protein insertion porin family